MCHDEVKKSVVGLDKRKGVFGFVGRKTRWDARYETSLRRNTEPKGGQRCVRDRVVRLPIRVLMTS